MSDNEVELAATVLGGTVNLVETIGPVDTHHTNHRQEDADTHTRRTLQLEGEAAKKQKELLEPVQDRVYEAIKQLALQQGYDAVIDRSSAQSMIFASPKIDISNEVLAKLGYSN